MTIFIRDFQKTLICQTSLTKVEITKGVDMGKQNDDADDRYYKNIFYTKSHNGEFTASVSASKMF